MLPHTSSPSKDRAKRRFLAGEISGLIRPRLGLAPLDLLAVHARIGPVPAIEDVVVGRAVVPHLASVQEVVAGLA
jgi:hypothetical protein